LNIEKVLENLFAKRINNFAAWTVKRTETFIQTRVGKVFMWLMVIGPFSLLPTVWEAWTAENIDALRTSTWPLMMLVDTSFFLHVARTGEWKIRLTVLLWIVMATLIFLATLVR